MCMFIQKELIVLRMAILRNMEAAQFVTAGTFGKKDLKANQ